MQNIFTIFQFTTVVVVFAFIKNNFKNILFSVSIIGSIYIAIDDFHDQGSQLYMTFFYAAAIVYFITIINIFLKYQTSRNVHVTLSSLFDEYPIINLILLPLLMGLITVLLGINNLTFTEIVTFGIIQILIILSIFMNVEKAVKEDYDGMLQTDESFDLMKIFTSYLFALLISRTLLTDQLSTPDGIIPIAIFIMFIVVIVLSKLEIPPALILFATLIVTVLYIVSFSILQINLTLSGNLSYIFAAFQTILLYILISIVQQTVEQTITKQAIIMYLSVILILIITLFYLGS